MLRRTWTWIRRTIFCLRQRRKTDDASYLRAVWERSWLRQLLSMSQSMFWDRDRKRAQDCVTVCTVLLPSGQDCVTVCTVLLPSGQDCVTVWTVLLPSGQDCVTVCTVLLPSGQDCVTVCTVLLPSGQDCVTVCPRWGPGDKWPQGLWALMNK